MKRATVGLLILLGNGAALSTAFGVTRVPTIRPNVSVAGVKVGGETLEEAARNLRVWWEDQKRKPLKIHTALVNASFPELKPSEMGVTLDDEASVMKLPLLSALADVTAITSKDDYPEQNFDPVFKSNGEPHLVVEDRIRQIVGKPRPARVLYAKGAVQISPEITTYELDKPSLVNAVATAVKSGQPVELPIVYQPKKMADETLNQIKEVVSEFHTHFPRRQYNRNANIKLASSRLNGVILLPGEQLSFNKTVGERTLKQGFMLAGVYKNGKHDTGIGGGICQVSTTLYNASLFGNLKIVRRSNHSMPVAYVPLGRDATVDYGSLDLVIENSYSTPIAVTSEYKPGVLTFRILGKKEPGESIKVIQEGAKSWDRQVQVIHDPKLKPGSKVVIDRGSRGHSIRSYRLVYKNGVLIKREPLGFSYYGGGDKIVAVGPTVAAMPPIQPAPAIQGTKISAPLPRAGN